MLRQRRTHGSFKHGSSWSLQFFLANEFIVSVLLKQDVRRIIELTKPRDYAFFMLTAPCVVN